MGDSVARTPIETPTVTTYAAIAMFAKLSFAFRMLANNAAIR